MTDPARRLPSANGSRPVRRLLAGLRRRWWLVVLVVLLGAAAGALAASRQTPVYAARLTFFVSNSAERVAPGQNGDELARQRSHSIATLATSTRLASRVVADQHLRVSSRRVAGEIAAAASGQTVLLDVTVHDDSQSRALAIATGVARQLPALITTLDAVQDPYGHPVATYLTVVNSPSVTSRPVSPDRLRESLVGAVLGLLAAALGLALAELRDRRVRTADQLEASAGAPFLGLLSYVADGSGPDTGSSTGVLAEQIRQLRTAVQFLGVSTVVVCGAVPGVGASSAARLLAAATAGNGRRVCLLSADLRATPPVAPGLTELLRRSVPAEKVLRRGADRDEALAGVDWLPGGTPPPNPADLLDSAATASVIHRLHRGYDLVVVEAPAVLPFADAAILARYVDAAILVARYGRTSEATVARAARAIRAAGGRVGGTVLALAPEPTGDSAYYRAETPTISAGTS